MLGTLRSCFLPKIPNTALLKNKTKEEKKKTQNQNPKPDSPQQEGSRELQKLAKFLPQVPIRLHSK